MNDYNGNNYGNYNKSGSDNMNGTGGQSFNGMPGSGTYRYGAYNNNMNEFSYNPGKPKKTIGRKILTGCIAVLSVAAIATTSIVGYTLITGKTPVATSENSSQSPSQNGGASDAAAVDRENLPTIEQLSTPEDALSIPQIVEKVSPSVVGISCITGGGVSTGSGIILSEDGYIITNAHVISGAQAISVVLPSSYADPKASDDDTESTEDNLTFTATKVGSDEQTDLAVLKIDKSGLVAAEIGKSEDVQVGEASIVIGNPLGLDLANSVTAGIISAKDRTITVEDRTMNLIQTDASVNNGNSGGPLINAYGQVIGITSAKVSSSVAEGLGFAIPIDEALPIIQDLMENGYVTGRPSLGITGSDITSAYSSYYGIPQGFLVADVTEGGGAEKAGIQTNDIIIAINDTMISSISELNEIKNKCSVGDTVTLTVYRNGKKIDIDVVLGESSGEENSAQEDQQPQDNYDNYNGYYNPFGGFGF
ncbi:MAG: trypsin-like peptidase domain-containing protein [Ruminococcus sp.]|nr:trypsin-like peptidase domain-containing protein [Ruminococcus sp.]